MDDARIKLPEQVYMRDPGTELATSAPMKQITNNQLQQSEDPSTGLKIEPHPILIGHQQSLCKGLSAHDGPLIRKTDIRKIPLEIWTNVAKYVRGDFDSPGVQYHTSGVNDVKNLRLTCTQLCAASSCHLLYRLDVLLTNTSMKQFEDVSQHPTISQGVQAFHVILRNPISARSLKDFIRQVLVMLQEAQDQDSSQFQQHTDLFEPILLSCTNYLQAEALRPYKDKNTIALCEFYEDYIHLIKEQEALLESGTFATRVGKAVARMPRATGLFIDERGTYDLGHLRFGPLTISSFSPN
ncbi:hypothetical protein F5883DRAFT_670401 [Diaporthe sp. PMI_573]|nr:hypothetical protein F5883DRAFT_670401 [Diaporthaceae sp. PMI_573]